MKTAFATKIMMLLMVVCAAGLAGCNEEKSDNSGLILALAASGGGCPWTVVDPSSNSRNVPINTDIVLRYEGGNLDPTITEWDVTLHQNNDNLKSMTDETSILTFDGDEVTVAPTSGFSDGETYSKMDITGFRDEAGIEIESCRLSTYNFTVADK